MASDVEVADTWGDLCKALEASEPLDIDQVIELLEKASRLPAINSPVDVSRDLRNFSQSQITFDSEELKGWWFKVQSSSYLITRTPLKSEEWQYLMSILTHADVSGIDHLVLFFDDEGSDGQLTFACDQLGTALSRRDFCQLETLIFRLELRVMRFQNDPALKSPSLGDVIRGAGLVNLRTLSIPYRLDGTVLNALADKSCILSQLTSFAVCVVNQNAVTNLDTVFKCGRLKSLQRFYLFCGGVGDADDVWEVLVGAIKSHNLPRLTYLYFYGREIGNVDLADLFRSSSEWFSSLETLHIEHSGITSEQVCSLVDAVMDDPKTHLPLKVLGLEGNHLGNRAVLALISLADSHGLPQLQALDLSFNDGNGMSKSLVPLVHCIGRGGMPRLQKLWWESSSLTEVDAMSVVSAYSADHSLTTEIIGIPWDTYTDPSLETKLKVSRDRNLRLAALRQALREKLGEDIKDFVPHTRAKVFLCGFPQVGKTTLRRALLRPLGVWTKLIWETRPIKQPPTRGIAISRIEKKSEGENIALLLWDLAGQEDYHVLHGAFLTDLGFEGGKATTFVLVFKAPYGIDAKEKLGYWLRFVASSSRRLVKRHVVVVLNCFHGVVCSDADQRLWKALIGTCATTFNDVLDIHLDPFIIDVRKTAPVQPLKDHLFNHARTLLEDVEVPRICFELDRELKRWSEGQDSNHLPILTWQAFEEIWKTTRNDFSVAALKYAAAYLHEIGEIIYFDKKLSKSRSGNETILVSDPEWFCRRVVGDLLLPKEMLEGGSCIKVGADGCISLFEFEAFFRDLLVGGIQSDDVISMLQLVGLCYRRGEQEIIVPALIRTDDYSLINWEGKGFHAVMGRCLVAKATDRNIIPMSLFRRLQVDLAQDVDFGGREDSDYKVGKSFLNFKYGELLVLIQFDVDHSDPTDDRIDILVRSAMRGDPAEARQAQVECMFDIMQKVEDLCAVCCDGLTYDIKVIQPCSAADRTLNMSERGLMSLKQIKDLVVKGRKYLGWQVDGSNLEPQWFLTKEELERLVGTVQQECAECRRDAVTMGLLPDDSCDETEAWVKELSKNGIKGDVQSKFLSLNGSDEDGLTPKIFHEGLEKLGEKLEAIVCREGRQIRQHIDKKSTELLFEFRREHELLVKHIQALQSFSLEEKESSVPRYMFLAKIQDTSWIRLTEAFQSTYQLHFLCEAHFDDGFLHEVKGQEGIALTKSKEWLEKVSPWLRRSLQVAVMVGKTVGNVYLPGVFNLIPDANLSNNSDVLARAVDKAARVLLEDESQGQDEEGRCGTATNPINVKEKLIAQEVVKDLINELGHTVFAQKIGLKKVLLRAAAQPHASSSTEAQPSVLWICINCYRKYGDRAVGI